MNLKTLNLIKTLTGLPVVAVGDRLLVNNQVISAVELLSEHSSEIVNLENLPRMGFTEEGEFTVPVLVFMSRHQPTPEQFGMARDAGYLLVTCEDLDPFDQGFLSKLMKMTAAVCRNVVIATNNAAAAVLAVSAGFDVAVFEAKFRPPENAVTPSYEAAKLHIYDGIEQTPPYIMKALAG